MESLNFNHEMGVSKNRGTPKWMSYNAEIEIPIKMDDLGVPPFKETPKYPPPTLETNMKRPPKNRSSSKEAGWYSETIQGPRVQACC